MTPWISVNDSVPDDEQTVLIFIPDSPGDEETVWLGYRDAGVWYQFDAWEIQVTHWMPLPEPPVIA